MLGRDPPGMPPVPRALTVPPPPETGIDPPGLSQFLLQHIGHRFVAEGLPALRLEKPPALIGRMMK